MTNNKDNKQPVFEIISEDFFSNNQDEQLVEETKVSNFSTQINLLNKKIDDDSSNSLIRDVSRRMLLQSKLTEEVPIEKKETINKTKIEALDSIEVEDVNLTGDFIINEFELTFLGNKIGVSTKKDVLDSLKKINMANINHEENEDSERIHCVDLGVTFDFYDNNILKNILFSTKFAYSTSKGLKIDDSINKAIKIYGKPKMRTSSAAVWKNQTIFIIENKVYSILIYSK